MPRFVHQKDGPDETAWTLCGGDYVNPTTEEPWISSLEEPAFQAMMAKELAWERDPEPEPGSFAHWLKYGDTLVEPGP